MKSVKVIGYGLWVIGMLLVSVPTMAQQEQWRSTSVMQTSGSAYAPQITAVGATQAVDMGTTTSSASYSPGRPGHIRRGFDDNPDPGTVDPGSPIGDPVLPLLLMALAFAGYLSFRRRRLSE